MTFVPKSYETDQLAKSLDEVSLLLRKARFGCLFFGGEKGDSGADFGMPWGAVLVLDESTC